MEFELNRHSTAKATAFVFSETQWELRTVCFSIVTSMFQALGTLVTKVRRKLTTGIKRLVSHSLRNLCNRKLNYRKHLWEFKPWLFWLITYTLWCLFIDQLMFMYVVIVASIASKTCCGPDVVVTDEKDEETAAQRRCLPSTCSRLLPHSTFVFCLFLAYFFSFWPSTDWPVWLDRNWSVLNHLGDIWLNNTDLDTRWI